jgi:hypothetical protein
MPIQKGPANLGTGTIETAELASNSVTTAKIADANITTSKIADANITTAKIADANVTTDKLATTLTVTHALGSASTPSITFTGDTNTGIFSPTADTIAFAEGGAEAARFDSSGNFGIGTNSPAFKLDVNGAGQFSGHARVTAGGGVQRILIGNQDSGGTNKPAIISSGNSNLILGYGDSWSGSGGTLTSLFSINSTGTSNDFNAVLTGGTTLYPAFFPRAFVAVNQQGSQSIIASGNISSIADGGVGLTTVNLTTAMPDANYAIVGGESGTGVISGTTIELNKGNSSQFQIRSLSSGNSTSYDYNFVCATVMR